MWYNIDSTNTMLVCRRKGGQNVTDRQDYRFILQIEPGRYASRGKRKHTEPREDLSRSNFTKRTSFHDLNLDMEENFV